MNIHEYVEVIKGTLKSVDDEIMNALAPTGKLRAGINLSNFLLVTGQSEANVPEGVSPDMAHALVMVLNCDIEFVLFDSPGAVADAVTDDVWDVGNIGAEPARAKFINFSDAYCEIEATFLIRENSGIKNLKDVDSKGVKIATKRRAAYTLWLERHLQHAQLVQFDSTDGSFQGFLEQGLDVLAGLKPRLLDDAQQQSDLFLLDEKFTAVQQAIGTPKKRNPSGFQYLQDFVVAAKQTGLVKALIDRHKVTNRLSVAGK